MGEFARRARNGQQSGRSSLLAMNKDVPIPYCPFYRPFTCQISAHEIKRFTTRQRWQPQLRELKKDKHARRCRVPGVLTEGGKIDKLCRYCFLTRGAHCPLCSVNFHVFRHCAETCTQQVNHPLLIECLTGKDINKHHIQVRKGMY